MNCSYLTCEDNAYYRSYGVDLILFLCLKHAELARDNGLGDALVSLPQVSVG